MLDCFFALYRGPYVVVPFDKDQALQPVTFGESLDHAFTMLPRPLRKIAGHTNVQRSIRLTCHDVNPTT